MIIARTYNGINGLNYVQDPDLAFATVYIVKREGTQYDAFLPGMLINRTYSHDAVNGKIFFPIVFDGGTGIEKVWILFKPVSSTPSPGPPPGVCVPGAIVPITLPGDVVGQVYNQNITLTGTAPFTLSAVTIPAWLSISVTGNTVNVSGTPEPGDETAAELIEFTANNCTASAVTFSQSISVSAATANLFVSNLAGASLSINSVSGMPFIILTGSFPITLFTGVTAIHNAHTGAIALNITGFVFPQTLTLQRNGVILETLFPAANGTYAFGSQVYTDTDEIVIILN